MLLNLTTVRDLDGEPIAAVDAQFIGGVFSHTYMVIATDPDDTGNTVVLHSYGPFATDDDARAWAAAHLAPYMTFAVAPLATPETNATASAHLSTAPHRSTTAPPARANIIAAYFKPYDLPRLRHTTRPDTARRGFTARESEHPHLGPVVELTALGPDPYQRDRDHSLMKTVLRHDHPRYEVTDQRTHLLVRRLSDAELHARADRAAARVAPHLAALTADTAPPAAAEPTPAEEAAHTLFDVVLRVAREVASDDPDDYDLMDEIRNMDAPDVLAALKTASLPSDMIGPIADALTLLAPHTHCPVH